MLSLWGFFLDQSLWTGRTTVALAVTLPVGVVITPPYGVDPQEWHRQMIAWMGRSNDRTPASIGIITGYVTLAAGAGSTPVTDDRVNADTLIGLIPNTVSAQQEWQNTNIFVTASAGAFTVNHDNNAIADRTYTYVIFG